MSRPPLRVSPALPAAASLSFLRRKKLTICRQCSGGMHLSARARKMADHGSTAPRSDGMKQRSAKAPPRGREGSRSEEHTSELQSLMRNSYAVFCLKKNNSIKQQKQTTS